MNIRPHLFLLIVLAHASAAFGQDVLVTPRRVVYTRAKPLSEDKAFVTIDHPKVRAPTSVLSRRIERSIGFETLMGLNLRNADSDQWLEAAGFDVDYNRNGILSVTLWISGSGHFSSTMYRRIVVDIRTGRQVTTAMVFRDMPGLARLVREHQLKEIERAKKEIPKMEGFGDFDSARWCGTSNITPDNLREFSVGDDGVTFRYDYGFPRIMLPAQPEGVFLISWRELKPFIRRGGLLGKLVS